MGISKATSIVVGSAIMGLGGMDSQLGVIHARREMKRLEFCGSWRRFWWPLVPSSVALTG